MNTRELKFRHELSRLMSGIWEITWHEDGRVNPGVPDMSVVSRGDNPTGYETTWIELKAPSEKVSALFSLGLEASQIQWIDTHKLLVPILVLARFSDGIYYCDPGTTGEWKQELTGEGWRYPVAGKFTQETNIRQVLAEVVRTMSARS